MATPLKPNTDASLFRVFIFARPDSELTQKRARRLQLNCVLRRFDGLSVLFAPTIARLVGIHQPQIPQIPQAVPSDNEFVRDGPGLPPS
jgi:hypothetical protein